MTLAHKGIATLSRHNKIITEAQLKLTRIMFVVCFGTQNVEP